MQDHQLDVADFAFGKSRSVDPDAVGQAVEQQRSQVGGGLHGERLQRTLFVAAFHDHRFVGDVEIQDRGAQLGRRVARKGFEHPETLQRLGVHDGNRHLRTAAVFGREVTLGMEHLELAGTVGKVFDQQLRHGDFIFGGLGQRDADRVADAVGHQRPDAHGALHAPLDAVPGLGDAQMDRIVHIFGIHRLDQQTVGGDHNARVRRLHRDHHLIEIALPAHPQKLHGRDHHALGRVTPLVEDALRQRPVVDADAQGDAPLAALRDQRLKIAAVEAVISRIDTHLVHIPGGDGRDLGHEVDVGHNGCPETVGTQLPDDVFQIFTFAPSLRRKAHDLSPGAVDPLDLGHARGGVVGVGIGHRLAGDGMPAADRRPPDAHFARCPAHEFRKIHRFIN